ncbi:MAG TPA: glycosyltransferase family 87 protein [Acidimicrobiales bacterium]|nr:glycosyltransferase family 87 protein [Acidimicrobiales bacterium]
MATTSLSITDWANRIGDLARQARARVCRISPEAGDALLYFASALFALGTIYTSSNALYEVWGRMALAPFVFGALASAGLVWFGRRARRRQPSRKLTELQHRRTWVARIAIAVCVFAGSLAVPLGLEVMWRYDGVAGSHQQPEVTTVEVGGQDLVKGTDPYLRIRNVHHLVAYHAPGEPDTPGFLPYLPLMAVLGIPSDIWPNNGLSDARIFFCVTTLAAAAVALYLCRADGRRKIRAVQALLILPVASLPLATGGDDIPVVAFLLLAMVLAQRRRPFWSGVFLGIASAMKFTAWPLAVLALFAARGRKGERRPLTMLAGLLVVAVPAIFPFALRGPFALIDDVVLFPLGLSAIPSTAASALPGHVLVHEFPSLSRVLPVSVGVLLAVLLARHLYRHTPSTVAQVCNITGVVMSALILLAPDPRLGYVLYPINFFVWAYLLAPRPEEEGLLRSDDPAAPLAKTAVAAA